MKRIKYILSIIGLVILLILVFSTITSLFGYIPNTPIFELDQRLGDLSGSDLLMWLSSPSAGKVMDLAALEQFSLLYPLTVLIVAIIGATKRLPNNMIYISSISALAIIISIQVVANYMTSSLIGSITGNVGEGSYIGIMSVIIGFTLTVTVIHAVYRAFAREI